MLISYVNQSFVCMVDTDINVVFSVCNHGSTWFWHLSSDAAWCQRCSEHHIPGIYCSGFYPRNLLGLLLLQWCGGTWRCKWCIEYDKSINDPILAWEARRATEDKPMIFDLLSSNLSLFSHQSVGYSRHSSDCTLMSSYSHVCLSPVHPWSHFGPTMHSIQAWHVVYRQCLSGRAFGLPYSASYGVSWNPCVLRTIKGVLHYFDCLSGNEY